MTATEPAGSNNAAAPGAQLLLVEDEESIGSLVTAYLEQTGYRVAWVRSGEDALATLDQVRPSVVILDIGLPGQDGFDVCRGIRARSTVPILMLTARDEEARPRRRTGARRGRLRREALLAPRARGSRQGSAPPQPARRAVGDARARGRRRRHACT